VYRLYLDYLYLYIYRYCVCAVLDSFPTVTEPQVHRPTVGRDVVLQCRPPRRRYPVGNIYWGISRPGSTQLKAIDNNDRVMLGYDGRKDYRIRTEPM